MNVDNDEKNSDCDDVDDDGIVASFSFGNVSNGFAKFLQFGYNNKINNIF